MDTVRLIVTVLAALVLVPWSPGAALAHHLLAPTGVGCAQTDGALQVGWVPEAN